jgi:hypothetical protein
MGFNALGAIGSGLLAVGSEGEKLVKRDDILEERRLTREQEERRDEARFQKEKALENLRSQNTLNQAQVTGKMTHEQRIEITEMNQQNALDLENQRDSNVINRENNKPSEIERDVDALVNIGIEEEEAANMVKSKYSGKGETQLERYRSELTRKDNWRKAYDAYIDTKMKTKAIPKEEDLDKFKTEAKEHADGIFGAAISGTVAPTSTPTATPTAAPVKTKPMSEDKALELLKKNPSPVNIEFFKQTYGKTPKL